MSILFFYFFVFLLIYFYSAGFVKQITLFFFFFNFLVWLLFLLKFSFLTLNFEYFILIYKFNVLNVNYCLLFDSLSLYFILLTALLMILCLIIAWNLRYNEKEFYGLLIILNFFLINVFAVSDLLVFYVFFEAIVMPMFILIGVWGSRERKIFATYQFFVYTVIGSVFMLFAVFLLYSHFGTTDIRVLRELTVSSSRQLFFWLTFFISVAVKVPMIPTHIWLPEAHVEAPTVGSVLLAGVLLKLGVFAYIKFLLPVFPFASSFFAPLIFVWSLVGLIYASFTTLAQLDMKKMVAYSSVAHMNFAVLGLFTNSWHGFLGCISLMLAHGLVSSGLFFCIGVLYDRYKTRLFLYYGGLLSIMPIFGFLFFVLVLANMSFPGTFNFIGEFLIFIGLAESNLFICLISGISMVLSAAYSLSLFNHVMLAEFNVVAIRKYADLTRRELYVLSTLSFLTVLFGVFPNLIMIPVTVNLSWYF